MRILHIDTGPEMRGGQHQALLLMNHLKKAGHYSMLLAKSNGPLAGAAKEAGHEVGPLNLLELWRRSKQASIIHAHDARAHTLAAVSARVPFVVSRRVAFPVKRSLLSRWKYSRPDRFLAVSKAVAEQLTSAGVQPAKIDVVYDGICTNFKCEKWDPANPAVTLSSDDPQKGRDLATAAARLANIPLVLSNDLELDLQRASMFLYVTQSEGLGSAALLAMQMGVPVIASAVGGLVEIILNGCNGILVENDANSIANAMRAIRFEAQFAEVLIEGGKRRVGQCFTARHLLERTLASYRKVIPV